MTGVQTCALPIYVVVLGACVVVVGVSERYAPDGIINFCHWGCKQAFGGSGILKAADIGGVPFLNLDGDGIDARNSHDGQLKTRLEAFLEIV